MISNERADEIAEAGKALACGGCSLMLGMFLLVFIVLIVVGFLIG